MPRNTDYDDLEDDDEDDEPRQALEGDRLVKHLRRQVKERDKRLADVEKQLSEFASERKTRTVAEVLKAREVNPKYARFITADVEDPTEEAVNKWLDENADLVGVQPQESTVDEDTQRGLSRMQDAGKGGKGPDADPIAAALADPNLTQEQLEQILGKSLRA